MKGIACDWKRSEGQRHTGLGPPEADLAGTLVKEVYLGDGQMRQGAGQSLKRHFPASDHGEYLELSAGGTFDVVQTPEV